MDWRPYLACCHRYAADAAIAFCPECRHALVRCLAFAECRSLAPATGPCPVCVAPTLAIDSGAAVQSKAGERVALPLVLSNVSPAARPFRVTSVARLDGPTAEPVHLTWEQVDAGTERRLAVTTPPLAAGGTYDLRVVLVIATRYGGVEESYAYSTGVTLTVAGADAPQTIQQTINVGGVDAAAGGVGTGAAVSAPLNVQLGASREVTTLTARRPLPLERAERYEITHGVRGYREGDTRVPRHVSFAFSGFRATERPADGATLMLSGRLACGRNSRESRATGTAPNDLCLRAYDSSGRLDEPATMAISRHHFDLVVVNDRLCVHARTSRGLQVNGHDVASGAVVPLAPGDRIVPIPGRPDKLSVRVAFKSTTGVVERVEISRSPATV